MDKQEIKNIILEMGARARAAAHALTILSADKKNEILRAMAASMREQEGSILEANAQDITAGEANGLNTAMLDRLRLNHDRVEAIATGIEEVAALADPVGEVLTEWTRPNDIRFEQIRVPIGVIGIIYESRPNVTSDAAVLCLKSGNATILRGGSEAIHSNKAIAAALQSGGEKAGLPANAIQLIPFTDRESVSVMASMDQWLDVIIPRGGKGLIETVVSLARMPVIKHYDGICHTYIDKHAEMGMAVAIADDAKTHKPGVCNALETLLVHRDVAADFLPQIAKVYKSKGVEMRGDESVLKILGSDALAATQEDWDTEYLDLIISIKVVDSMAEAVDHINTHSSRHSDCIVTSDGDRAQLFMTQVDSACVFHNVSTRFSDGGEFGFGAEIGISTDKLHARGPMALRELTSYQYRVRGDGQIRSKNATT
ncbi:glutamate-5-semialdehyde dehydrogenase [Akkermansiaceae bacterium]|nr:glutamate-5-semialdehyde dehydrogenase [Akkermansiaceae bacterium]